MSTKEVGVPRMGLQRVPIEFTNEFFKGFVRQKTVKRHVRISLMPKLV